MRRIIYLAVCMVGMSASSVTSTKAQVLRDSVMVRGLVFSAIYSEVLQQPKRVWYEVQCPNGSYPRAGMDFYGCDSIRASDGKDYEANVWDKGHCAPAADFNCDREMLFSTFTFLNCCLQDQYLNRGTWRLLEEHERQLSSTGTVKVSILMIYSPTSIKLSTGATVPDGFYKYITVNGKTTIYFFKNEKPLSTDYTKYVVAKGPKLTLK